MSNTGERSVIGVLGDVADNLQRIVRAEIRLAKVETREELAVFVRGAIWCGIAAAAALFGVMYVLLAAVYTLALWWPLWAAALVVGIVMLIVAGVGAAIGVKRFHVPTLTRTGQSLKENVPWTR